MTQHANSDFQAIEDDSKEKKKKKKKSGKTKKRNKQNLKKVKLKSRAMIRLPNQSNRSVLLADLGEILLQWS